MVVNSSIDQSLNRAHLLDHLVHLIGTVDCDHPLRVGIDGVDASGKTFLANELSLELRQAGRVVIQATVDGFHNPRSIRYRRGEASPEGYFHDSFNYNSITDRLLVPLGPGGNRSYQTAVYDYRTDQVVDAPSQFAPDDAVLLFDGIFLQRPEISGYWDLSLYVDVSVDIALERATDRYLARNGQAGELLDVNTLLKRYKLRYIPAQQHYSDGCHPKESADIVVDNNDLHRPFISRSRL